MICIAKLTAQHHGEQRVLAGAERRADQLVRPAAQALDLDVVDQAHSSTDSDRPMVTDRSAVGTTRW
jgi:hypothetical protein